jgi:hypothetical protein
VREVERENGEPVALGECHHRRVHETEVEICVPCVQLDGSPQKPRSHAAQRVLTAREGPKEQACGLDSNSIPHEVIDLYGDRVRDDELAPEAAHKCRGQRVRRITAVDRRNERPRVRDSGQRDSIASRMYSSTRRLRSGGPSPEPT